MKPVLLEIEAFGPYSDLQVIDFRLLKDVNMFLIHGSTGGGKTTILDAICYGLYGETSGKERDPESMRSHFAKEDQLTQVKFTFQVGQNTYYVHRIPGQDRPKKVGEGFTYQNPTAELYRLNGDDKELLATRVTDVRDKIIDLIGFDSDQFRQVVIIPQGQFRKLLVARSEERQKILGEIFQTGKYKRVEEKIREEERTLKNEVAAIKERRKEQIKNIKYRPDTLLEALMEKESIDTDQVITQVEVLCKSQEEEIKAIAKDIAIADEKLKKMASQITIAINNNEKHKEKLKVKKQYDELIAQEALYKTKEKDHNLAQKALPLRTKEQYINDLALQKETIEKEVKSIKEEGEKLEKDHKAVTIQMDQCKKEEPETKEKERKRDRAVEEYRPKSISLISLEKEKVLIEKEISQSGETHKELNEKKQEIDKGLLEAEKALEQRQPLNDELRKQEIQSERLGATLVQKRQLVKLETNHKELQARYQQVHAELKKVGRQYASSSDSHNAMLKQWIKAQAGELAKNLKTDEACPVCGSRSHPRPAISDGQAVTEKELEIIKQELDLAHKHYLEVEKKHASITMEGKKSKEQLEQQKEVLGDYAEVLLEEIEKAYNKLEDDKKKTNKALVALGKLEEKTIKQKTEKTKIDEAITALQEKDKENANKFTALNTQIDQIKKDIPEPLRSKEKLDEYIRTLEKAIKKQKEIFEKTSKELEALNAKKIELKTKQESNDTQLKAIRTRYEKEEDDFKGERERLGFESFEMYKKAYRSQEELEALDTEIKSYRNLYSAIEGQYKKLKEETKDIVLSDVEALDEEYKALEKVKDDLARAHQTVIVEKEHNEHQSQIILKSSKMIRDKEKRYGIVGNLYDAVRGKNIKGLSFERFIQSSLFEDVLIRANERLTLMSNSRYELYRSDNRETMASQSGLDLEVLDTYTGKKRHVRTLSGGEGFMASLSLALGLADVVQSYAGGISIDTIFIDEGFGTLDTESLDAAVKTLIDLQQSGRLVGIISHVPELKERIGARLEVMTTQRGSRAKFHI